MVMSHMNDLREEGALYCYECQVYTKATVKVTATHKIARCEECGHVEKYQRLESEDVSD